MPRHLLLLLVLLLHSVAPAPTPPSTPPPLPPTTITILSPPPSIPLYIKHPGSPLTFPISLQIDIDRASFEAYAEVTSTASVVLSMSLSTLTSTPTNPTFDPLSTATFSLEDYTSILEADVEKLIPGARSIMLTVTTRPAGLILAETVAVYTVLDPTAASTAASLDVSSFTPSAALPQYDEYFSQVYRYKVWSAGDTLGPSSGPGSQLHMTSNFRTKLADLVTNTEYGVRRIIDVPCGDLTYFKTLLPLLSELGIEYLGMDVVNDLIVKHDAEYADNPMVTFKHHDLSADPFPATREGDVIICRHLMFHLPPVHNYQILNTLASTSASYLLATTYLKAHDNSRDFVFAMGHLVNLFREPYCVRDPRELWRDDDEDLYMGLWQLGERLTNHSCL